MGLGPQGPNYLTSGEFFQVLFGSGYHITMEINKISGDKIFL